MQDKNLEVPKRPEFLKFLCIISFLGGGLSLVTYGFMYFYFEEWVIAFNEGQFDELMGTLDMEAIEVFLNVNSNFFLFQALLFGLSILGVYNMWKLKKLGFHMYSIAQILLLITQQVYLPSLPFPLIPFLLTLTFILLYARNLSFMR